MPSGKSIIFTYLASLIIDCRHPLKFTIVLLITVTCSFPSLLYQRIFSKERGLFFILLAKKNGKKKNGVVHKKANNRKDDEVDSGGEAGRPLMRKKKKVMDT